LPKYGTIAEEIRSSMEHVYDGVLNVAWRDKFVGIDKYVLDRVTYYFVDNEEYYNREGFYGYPDDAERFSSPSPWAAHASCPASMRPC